MHKGDKLTGYISSVANTLTSIWKAINELVWDNKIAHPALVCSRAIELSLPDSQNQGDRPNERQVTLWSKPNENTIKINCATSFDHKTNMAGLAILARDHDICLRDCYYKFTKTLSPRSAEVAAVLMGMKMVQRNSWASVVIASPNMDMVCALNCKKQNRWDSSAIEQEINRMATSLNCNFSYEARARNKPETFLAKKARTEYSICIDSEYIPEKLCELLNVDKNSNVST